MTFTRRRPRFLGKIIYIFIILGLLSSCIPEVGSIRQNPENPGGTFTPTPFQPQTPTIYLSKAVPESWVDLVRHNSNLEVLDDKISANLFLSLSSATGDQDELASLTRVFAVAAQFPTVYDTITLEELKGLWGGDKATNFSKLLVSAETRNVFEELWSNPPSDLVNEVLPDEMLIEAWKDATTLAIIPFEEISPRWKVLKIGGVSPLDKPMNVVDYPLAIKYHLVGSKGSDDIQGELVAEIQKALPATNRDESKMTVLVMSGTTALVRTTAYKIEAQGTDYPISEIKGWFLTADIRHVSNEISINKDCPDPDPYAATLQFCTKKEYLPVLEDLGINVVELTGNHLNDYGPEKLAETISVYNQLGMAYFGGGVNLDDAKKPLKMTMNGNKVAFIGCNFAGPPSDFATESRAGSAPCDMDFYNSEIEQLKNQGYSVVATFQYNELYEYMYDVAYEKEFHEASNSGADIVQGSQAHYPMGFEFVGNSLIHYGLGNFLFDQMDYPVVGTRREFIDRHIIYDGKYINTELLTALLTDYSKPVPMTEEQRFQFLTDIFTASKMR